MEHTMNDKADRKIEETLSKLETTVITGAIKGLVWLTPKSVKNTEKPLFWRAHAKFKFNHEKGASVLKNVGVWKDGAIGEQTALHIYKGGLKFPEVCAACLEPVTHHEVVEVTIRRRSSGRTTIDTTNYEKAERIFTAMDSDRFWYVISFSDNHGIDDRAIHFDTTWDDRDRCTWILKNREYAQQFAKLNKLKGSWLRVKHIIMRQMGFIGMTVFGFAVVLAGLLLYLPNGEWGQLGHQGDLALFIIGLIGFVFSSYLALKGNKGEPILSNSD